MFNPNKKKRANIKNLKESVDYAATLLIKRGIAHKDNVLEALAREAGAPILPGLPSYLPHRWTIEAGQRAMHALLMEWMDKTKANETRQNNASEFFRFVVRVMEDEERKFRNEAKTMRKETEGMRETKFLAEIFSPHRKYETTKALHKFFVDSFAVSVLVKQNDTTWQYADWFLNDWTVSLYKLWTRHASTATTVRAKS